MSIPPQKTALPRRIDARKLVQREQQLDGVVPSEALPRLGESVESVSGDVVVELTFSRDLQRNQMASGHLTLDVNMLCQRCLQPVAQHVEGELAWGFVWSEEQGKALPKSLDPVIQEGDELDLYQVLEDEILLNLPMVAFHDGECVPQEHFHSEAPGKAADEQQENPFKVLEQLKGSSSGSK
ncbi:YceD family protein [Microbulbifer celer]|uniref:Large ribosomal RNA subunit accumulation protein YceD n=1 Tax=Microbulbifer celer TaxID=435905 RepID=A0ABW3U7Q9_9GAMM|nr:YceD family protein [Microbulbifer celer]UFN58743.1 YceD family protein [Microbulbifer celer]